MKTIFITGGSKGIGKQLIYQFLNNGHNVFFTYNNSENEANNILNDLKLNKTADLYAFKCDLSNNDEVKQLFKANKELFSNIDVLINNAGITNKEPKHFLLTSSEEWWKVMHNNIDGVLNCTRSVLPIILRKRQGRIINITSLSGIKGNPGQSAYASSKAAISAFSKSLAKELKNSGIIINCIAPGFIETEMTKGAPASYYNTRLDSSILKRMGTTNEIANIVNYLAIDAPEYLINQEVIIDGGMA